MADTIYVDTGTTGDFIMVGPYCYQFVELTDHPVDTAGTSGVWDSCDDCINNPTHIYQQYIAMFTGGSWNVIPNGTSLVATNNQALTLGYTNDTGWVPTGDGCVYTWGLKGGAWNFNAGPPPSLAPPDAPTFTPDDCGPAPCSCPCTSWGDTWPCSGLDQTYSLDFNVTITAWPSALGRCDHGITPTCTYTGSGHTTLTAGISCNWGANVATWSPTPGCSVDSLGHFMLFLDLGPPCRWLLIFNYETCAMSNAFKETGVTPKGPYSDVSFPCFNCGNYIEISITEIVVSAS